MDKYYMNLALEEAKCAMDKDEVPVGAVIVHDGQVIAKAHNLRETNQHTLGHAELEAIQIANDKLGSWQLKDCTLYVTLEPCVMCAGAILQSRIKRVVFGAYDEKGGAFGSITNLNEIESLNHHIEIQGNILEDESKTLLKTFFKHKRKSNIKIKRVTDEHDFELLKALRYTVFVDEQHVDPDIEYDAYDSLDREDVLHIAAIQENRVVGGLRLILKDKIVKVGRVVVDQAYRNQKIGTKLLDYAERYTFNNGYATLELGAQLTAIPFYEASGYKSYGEVYMDANIEHKMMKKSVR